MVEVPLLTVSEWGNILLEIQRQPAWRRNADREADYYDGNQLDSETLRAMEELGMAPIVENLIAPTIDSVLGQEAKSRLDFHVSPQSDDRLAEMAEAMNQKLNEAERESKADRACADAFAGQVKVGIDWVTVGTEHDPFKYPHKAERVHRNEAFWDFKAREPDLSDARYFIRRRWHDHEQIALAFPEKKDLINGSSTAWASIAQELLMDGGRSTDLAMDYNRERAWTIQEQEWRDSFRRRLCLSEVWYRRWVRGQLLRAPDGRVVEYDESNPLHLAAVAKGVLEPFEAMYSKVRLSWWIGPHCLADIENPYKHGKIPYVPFFGKREDMTGVPYGLIRAMKPLQDEINARNTKMIWLLAAKRVTMTKGVADINDTRMEAARPDAVHVLDPAKMREGGVFKVETDFTLNDQQYKALVDKRATLKNVAGVYSAFEGQNSNASSGTAINSLVEQSSQTLADIYDNYRFARAAVGELLLSNVIQEMGSKQVEVKVKSAMATNPKVVVLNQPTENGLTNDIQRALLKVSLSDVPTTSSYRQQQAVMFAEILKSLPPDMQAQLMDFYLMSTDMPHKEKAVERIRKLLGLEEGQTQDPQVQQLQLQLEQGQQMLQELQLQAQESGQKLIEAQMALRDKSGELELKARELDMKEQEIKSKSSAPTDDGTQAALAARLEAEKMDLERERNATELRAKEIEREIELSSHASAERIKQMERELAQMQRQLADEDRKEKESKAEKAAETAEEKAESDDIVTKVTESIAPALKALMDEISELKAAAAKDAKEDKTEKVEKEVFYEKVADKDGNLLGVRKVVK